jgi:ABC-type sugar transport system, periplasmic component
MKSPTVAIAALCAALCLPSLLSAQAVDKFKKFDPPITLTYNKTVYPSNYPAGQDAQNNTMYAMFENLMGIKVVNKIEAPASSMKDKMQLAIASGDVPDFGLVDKNQMALMIKGGLVEDLTPYYQQWATDNLKTVLGQSGNVMFGPSTKNGKIYGLPAVNTVANNIPILWVRADWRKKLGLAEPATMEDVFKMAEAFALKDPDGDGKKDTVGLYMDKDLFGVDWMMNAYGVYPRNDSWMRQADGSFAPGCIDPKAKIVLQRLAELYKEGALDREFAIKDTDKENELIASGKLGMTFGYFYTPLVSLYNTIANVKGAEWEPLFVPAREKGGSFKAGVPLDSSGYVYVKKGCAHPEAIVIMMNQICDGYAAPWLAGSVTEFQKRYNELAMQGKANNNMFPFEMAGNINWGPIFKKAYDSGQKHVDGKDADYQRVLKVDDPAQQWAWRKIYLEAYFKVDYDRIKYGDYNGASTETMIKVQSLLDKEKLTSWVAIIMGAKPASDFDAFVKRYNDIGAKKIATEIKAALD